MSLPAVAGNTLLAADLYQLCQPSGGQEKGKYFLQGGIYGNGASISDYMSSTSRNATPVSVSIDTADQAPVNGIGGVSTSNLTANGFLVFGTSTTGPNTLAKAGGNSTIQY